MCNTPYCFGDCEDCIAETKIKEDMEDSNKKCPYRKECKWQNIDAKHDKCLTCGHIEVYP